MAALLDANMLIALVVNDHVHHQAAERWFVERSSGFATCPLTQGSLLRLLVREGLTVETALGALQALANDARHEFWPDDLSYSDVPMRGVIGHRQLTDAYLAQLARRHQGRFATFDQGLAALHTDVAELVETG